jgi:hypothetical protein
MKLKRRTAPALLALSLGVAVTACDDATGVAQIEDAVVADLAVLAADATLEDLGLWRQTLGLGAGAEVAAQHEGGGTFTANRTVTFYDADGNEQVAYDALATASMLIQLDIERSVSREQFQGHVSRSREMTVSGLEGEETTRTWNGSGTEHMERSGVREDGTERSHESDATFVYESVVMPIPGSDSPYPLAGTVRRSMVATLTTVDGTRTREVDIVITFDGTSVAQATINGEPVEIDLSAREGRNPLRRRR